MSALPAGKTPASPVDTPVGSLVTRVDGDQNDMVYAPEGPFSPGMRLERAMQESSFAFRTEPLGAHPSNFHELAGGMREPDPFLVVVEEGNVRYGKPYAAEPELLEDLEALLGGVLEPEDQDEALCQALEELIARDPKMPLLNERLAGCYQAVGKMAKALEALARELEVNPSHPGAHMGLAAAAAAAGKQEAARTHAILALMYYPAFDQPRKWINAQKPLGDTHARLETFAPRLSVTVDEVGYVVIRSPGNQPWVGDYATCKAGFRYAPEVRMAFGMKSGPYRPSLLEEMVCLRLAADGYARDLEAGGAAEVIGDVILGAASEGRLVEAAFFEVLGMNDPDLMKFLPEELASAVVAWIEDTVLSSPS
jgi:tetratricopeptide (TPR) repeat protein